MSGHSKWSTIKHKKAITDAKRGAVFTKLARLIEVAAKSGPNLDMNFKLKLAVQKAKAANMPASHIDKAIKKGAGLDRDKSNIEEVIYEGLGPANVAIMVQALTDNKNRTVSDLRNIFAKSGGSLGNTGSVAWQFASRGLITVDKSGDDLELKLIDAGAEEVEDLKDVFEVHTDPKKLNQVKQTIEKLGIKVREAKLAMVPTQTIKVTDAADAKKIINLMNALDDNPDVSEVFANFDIDENLM
ncbi:YebC/PmpR family DNA-binding transcriptional regulator [candidate division Kazan bacterium]|uniref:Probable transcriptional regulatory protein DRH29_01045 n=1 Tax=candidate division Kazan bacterium TaxID=2202143 RepID=A0A420ZDG7_UNCK3|nr:MAG: YebC/PmpR family DNA-binding transcriptional regulator [candidate division Kazan bacterium]